MYSWKESPLLRVFPGQHQNSYRLVRRLLVDTIQIAHNTICRVIGLDYLLKYWLEFLDMITYLWRA